MGKDNIKKINVLKIESEIFTMILKTTEKSQFFYRGSVIDHTIKDTITIKLPTSIISKNWLAKRDPTTWYSIDR